SKGNDGERKQGGAQGNCRSQDKEHLVDMVGNDVFLEEKLQSVGNGLQEAARTDAVGTNAVLHPGGDLTLRQDLVRADRQDDREDAGNGDERRPKAEGRHGCALTLLQSVRKGDRTPACDRKPYPWEPIQES